MARSIRKRVEEGAERPCILIGDPLEEACRVVHIFVGCDVRDRSRTHTLELYYPSISLLFSRSPFFFFLILLAILVRWYRVIRAPLYPLTVSQPTVFSRILVFRVESSRENDYQSGRVSHRVKFYRRNICPGDRFITGANAGRESSRVESSRAKNFVPRWSTERSTPRKQRQDPDNRVWIVAFQLEDIKRCSSDPLNPVAWYR